jgi:hypothetical protein
MQIFVNYKEISVVHYFVIIIIFIGILMMGIEGVVRGISTSLLTNVGMLTQKD